MSKLQFVQLGCRGIIDGEKKMKKKINRRQILETGVLAGLSGSFESFLPIPAKKETSRKAYDPKPKQAEESITVDSYPHLIRALQLAADAYPANRVQDLLSSSNPTGYRMTVSPNGFPISICMSPDLTFGMLGSRFIPNKAYLDTFQGHANFLPRNMRRNGKFFINEDLIAGADRVFSQVLYLVWIWELYLATGNQNLLESHQEPLKRCLRYIESRTSPEGIVNQVDQDDWQYSEGADWVDWCPERMEGSTCVYHTWYAYALRGCTHIFDILGDKTARAMCEDRRQRQQAVLDRFFWNGQAYWDNLNFQGEKVGRFWCDSQIWPIAFGLASSEQSGKIFHRIDSEPDIFEGVPLRWCAPIPPADEDPRYQPGGKYGDTPHPELRPYSWFGRLGSGDILARFRTGQNEHAFQLILRYTEVVSKLGAITECLDMQGRAQEGTGGASNYLEHAGGLLWCVGKGLFGVDDTQDGTLTWNPRLPFSIHQASMPYWHMGHCWKFGCTEDSYWIDSGSAPGEVQLIENGEVKKIQLDGKRIQFPRPA